VQDRSSSDLAVVAVGAAAVGVPGRRARAAGGSFMIHVRHADAAVAPGLRETVLITDGESGRSNAGRTRNTVAPTSLAGQFEQLMGRWADDFSRSGWAGYRSPRNKKAAPVTAERWICYTFSAPHSR
jgi:hypothetical protein